MSPKFNIDRPKISDEEIKKHQDFDKLVRQFKEQSLKQARGDESWWKNKRIRYSTIIAGVTVVCTVTYLSLFKAQKQAQTHETATTLKTPAVQSSKAFISEPSKHLKIRPDSYAVNNATGGTIVHAGSSKIRIPKNSFIDKNGKDIVGEVTIEYKEFHDAGDVIASGIPMAYDSAGTAYNLETAGMFDIRGHQHGEPVFIKPGQNLQVELASKSGDDRFNQYYLDTAARNWQYMKRDNPNEIKAPAQAQPVRQNKNADALIASDKKLNSLKNQIEVVIPKKIDSVKVVYTNKVEKLPVPKEPAKPAKASGRPSFQLDADLHEFPELQAFKNAVFEVGAENTNYSKDLHDVTWSNVAISQGPSKGKNYLLTLSYRSRTEKLIVYPVLSGADYDKSMAVYEQKFESYEQLRDKRVAEEKRLIAEMEAKQAAYLAEQRKKENEYKAERAKLFERYNIADQNELASEFNSLSNSTRAMRIFNVSLFGVYNSDCPHEVPQGASILPAFIASEKNKEMAPDAVYLVDHTNRTVYSVDKRERFRLKFDPNNTYSLCVFEKDKLFLCNKEQFKLHAGQGQKFVLTPLSAGTDNLVDFKKALEI